MRNDGFHDRQDRLDRIERERKANAVTLRDLVARAIPIIETERECLADSHSVGGELRIDPDDEGDQQAQASIDAMDAWLANARKAVDQ